ncbi:zinc-ribbon domain-containing protein [Paracoccus tibetensis]|uniref:MJ0042 family finger-like domain-containing protein n=1 Tax=Paracoccus tibetensis TaxID=336292 RepID=A0A1G5GA96_9RHOB|nr:zinc-ribbon domain-containing protein [Paracoccus tibetensis]SCY48536.1 MJ0042 family finger-like domain-containing protein [Paracoccus tibetensis]
MAEIRLICPGCAAEYRLPSDAIPPTGREVECSACGHLWQARPPQPAPLDLGDFAAPRAEPARDGAREQLRPIPPAAARLPSSVLDILRGEVEHERRLRAAEAEAQGRQPPVAAPAAEAESGAAAEAEPDWPATTVTMPAGGTRELITGPQHANPQPATRARPAPRPEQALEAAPPAPPAAAPVIRHAAPPVSVAAEAPRSPAYGGPANAGPAEPRPRARPDAQRTGFGLAVMLGAAALALYLLAPNLAQNGGPIGQRLMELRHEVDRGRLWLQDQTGARPG